MLPGTAFHTESLATKVIAPVMSHWMQRRRASAMTSSNHSSICVRGLSTRENRSNTEGAVEEDMGLDGWMDGWVGL